MKPKNSMRICVLIDVWEPIWGGGPQHVWKMSQILATKYKCEIDVYTRSLRDGYQFSSNQSFLKNKLKIIRIGPLTSFSNFYGRILWLITVSLFIYKAHKKNPYTLIHAHAYASAIPAKILSVYLKIPVIFTVHGCNNLDLYPKSLIGRLENYLLTRIHFDKEISVSYHFLIYPNVNSVTVIPNGVDLNDFKKPIQKEKRNTQFTFLFVGRFEKVKAVDQLIKAFSLVHKQEFKTHLNLVGYGSEETVLRQLTRKLNLEKNISFLGKKTKSELAQEYNAANLYVSSSRSEGQPITLFEAWAAKLPVLATKVGDNAKYVKRGINGYLIAPDNFNQLAKGMAHAMYNNKLKNLGLNGYKYVKKYCAWDQAAARVYEIYKNYG